MIASTQPSRRLGRRGRAARMNGLVDQRLGELGQSYVGVDWTNESSPTLFSSPVITDSPGYSPGVSSSGGGLTTTEAALISQGISTAGKVATQNIIGTPTFTYNSATGQYSATGGATLPASSLLGSSLTTYLPYILLAGGLALVLSMRH